MSFRQKFRHEIWLVAATTLYFAAWFGALMVLKTLVLAEYQIGFHGVPMMLVASLIVAKVVLVLEYVPLGAWIRKQPALVDVVLRTTLYALGVVVVLLVEKAFEARHDYGGFGASLTQVLRHAEIHHVWANAICVTGALLGFNALAVLRRRLGEGRLSDMFLRPYADEANLRDPNAER